MELRCQPSLALPASEFGDGVGDGGQGPGKCHADIIKPPAPTGMEGPGFGEEGGGGWLDGRGWPSPSQLPVPQAGRQHWQALAMWGAGAP